jgi:hypothetical protein
VQVNAAPAAAGELRASTTYAALFGQRVPDKDMLANGLDFASSWSREATRAKLWLAYAKSQANLAWDFVLRECDALKDPLVYASGRDGSVATDLSSLLTVVTARSESSRKGGVTKKAKQQSKAKAKAEQPPPPSMVTSLTKGHTA